MAWKKGKKLSNRQKAYLGANVWVHGKGGKVNVGASRAKNRKFMKSSERAAYMMQRQTGRKDWASARGLAKKMR